ncbi:FAD-binding protein [Sneathiella chinensis]|uniref:2-hydroxy-acid oxidase n=1 Tax=Sneathiella chinensis TaxID=349750 RepID=A0ABQ5U429_9PROT|nr:FAD-binding protein [Sneathiella chinensis]GLQ06496.1 2-hydroxy-acid oxidase [Sneathiella chinensis]
MRQIEIKTEDQISDVLEWALAGKHRLAIAGAGTKIGIGRPVEADAAVRLEGLSGVELYEPAELVMQAQAGTRLTEIRDILGREGQKLAFDPPDYGPLLGHPAGLGTIGGIFCCNLSGAARVKAGAARDHLLGVQGFTGRGQAFKTGSRVMKNVTGYDLCKLVAGSYGTLTIASRMTFKVLPRPEKTRTVLVFGVGEAEAVAAMRDALSSEHEVCAAAYLPEGVARRSGVSYLQSENRSVVALRIEGPGPSAEFRCVAIRGLMAAYGETEELHGQNSGTLWRFVGDVGAFVQDDPGVVWKVSVPPAGAPAYLKRLREHVQDMEYYLDWGGGLIWIALPNHTATGGEYAIRQSLNGEGHATLIRGSESLRASIAPFQPQNPVLARISEKIREGFDPHRILNPGRMYAFGGEG